MEPSEYSQPELLAPAGGPEALRAAVAGGADAVYLGLDRLNARGGAVNFTLETLRDACRFAHLHGVGVYLTANVVILPDEMSEALELVDAAWAAGVDAVIVQDAGLLRCIRDVLPHVRIHASTQMNAYSRDTVAALADRGCSRVTLARESSLDGIAELVAAGATSGVEIESFVHGAICVSYSGQCLFSSMIGGRSANRGQCAQPCRLTYDLVDEAGEPLAHVGAHLLSPKDLAGVTVLPALIQTGVSALKIEGRAKSPEYVAIVTRVYRDCLNRALADPDGFSVTDSETAVLAEAFSRGSTTAYLTGERGNAMMSYRRPNNRGVPVGRIVSVEQGVATIDLDAALEGADTIEIWTRRGRFAQPAEMLTVDGDDAASAPAGRQVRIRLRDTASTGDRVFRVRNAALLAAARRTFENEGESAPIPVAFEVRVVTGEPAQVLVRDLHGRLGRATGGVVEPARTRAVTAEEVIEHVGRLGGSGFASDSYDVALSPGAGLGFSELHRLRREALDGLSNEILAPWEGRAHTNPRVPAVPASASAPRAIELVAVVSDEITARACLEAGADLVHVPTGMGLTEPVDRIVPLLPRADRRAGELAFDAGRVVVGTLGQLHRLSARDRFVETHWSLNVTNPHAVAEFADMGASLVWLSPEMNGEQIARIATRSGVPVGVAIFGRQELMITEHCVLMAQGECDRACITCDRRRSVCWLKDRKGYRFPVRTDESGRTHVYNSVPLDLLDVVDEVLDKGVSALRLDLETFTSSEAVSAVKRARRALDMGGGAKSEHRDHGRSARTTGHFYRGIS